MARARLRMVDEAPAPDPAPALPPLRAAGLVLRKADVVAALRVWIPGAVDLAVSEDGEHYFLFMGDGGNDARQAAR